MQDALKLIQQYYDYFNNQDITSFLGLLDKNVVHEINQGDCEVGIEAFSLFMDKMNTAYQEKVKELSVLSNNDGSRASAEFFIEGIYLNTDQALPQAKNQKYRLRCGAFFEIKNNKITRVTNYYNMNDWLKQVGD
ncbi:MAG: nuclear transport factor 2 family protein [Candidatus Berkiella sp.]